jgi:hypothetical protein
MIRVPQGTDEVFVHVPPRLDLAYLADVLSRKMGRDVPIANCAATNLCANSWGGVSNSGATVLRLALALDGGNALDLVAKVLSPDPVNLFKIDCRFSSRLTEVSWADWWGKQKVSWVPVVYDTRADTRAREFWIIREYFPQVGWAGFDATQPKGMGRFSADVGRLRALLRQVALLHAYSRLRIEELRDAFLVADEASVPSQTLQSWVQQAVDESSFLSEIGVADEERAAMAAMGAALGDVPRWVEQWDTVCVTADWGPDNLGLREGHKGELVIFDWGTARLAPMEEDIDVLWTRIEDVNPVRRAELLAYYLDVYAGAAGRRIEPDAFRARMPWARFFCTLRYLLGHLQALRWVPHQTRSREYVHLFIRLARRQLAECRKGDLGTL